MTHGMDTSFLVALEIAEHAQRPNVRATLTRIIADGDRLAIAPPVLAEFVHIVTDAKRFERPLAMHDALEHSQRWWNAAEVDRVFPTDGAISLFHEWMNTHRLGRKRVLDTMLAATYRTAGITSLLTLNPDDFSVFHQFSCVTIAAAK